MLFMFPFLVCCSQTVHQGVLDVCTCQDTLCEPLMAHTDDTSVDGACASACTFCDAAATHLYQRAPFCKPCYHTASGEPDLPWNTCVMCHDRAKQVCKDSLLCQSCYDLTQQMEKELEQLGQAGDVTPRGR